jgi:hypothetical protein
MYNYNEQKAELLTTSGFNAYVQVKANAEKLLKESGAFKLHNVIQGVSGAGSSWTLLACVDKLVENKEIKEIPIPDRMAQDRIFVKYFY